MSAALPAEAAEASNEYLEEGQVSKDSLEALEWHPALKELHAQLVSFPLTQSILLRVVNAYPSMTKLPIFNDFVSVLEALTRPVTTRGAPSASMRDEVDQEVAETLEVLPSNIDRIGFENALEAFIAEWR